MTAALLLVLGCTPSVPALATPTATPRLPTTDALARTRSSATDVGREQFLARGCGGCHTLPGLPGARGVAGPNLANVTLRPTLAGDTIPMTFDAMVAWLLDPPAVKPGARMPSVGLTTEEAQQITAFLFAQPVSPGP